MNEPISLKDKQRAIKMAYTIIGDKRNVSRYGGTTITSKDDPSLMFTYPDMIDVLESMYAELEEAQAMQKPLTLKQLRTLIDDEQEAVVYIETNSHTETYANIIYERHIFDRYGETEGADVLRFETYGKTWRAWASRPTDEERAAAPWGADHGTDHAGS